MLVGKAAFFGYSLWGKEVGVTISGEVLYPYETLADQVFQVGIDEPQAMPRRLDSSLWEMGSSVAISAINRRAR